MALGSFNFQFPRLCDHQIREKSRIGCNKIPGRVGCPRERKNYSLLSDAGSRKAKFLQLSNHRRLAGNSKWHPSESKSLIAHTTITRVTNFKGILFYIILDLHTCIPKALFCNSCLTNCWLLLSKSNFDIQFAGKVKTKLQKAKRASTIDDLTLFNYSLTVKDIAFYPTSLYIALV